MFVGHLGVGHVVSSLRSAATYSPQQGHGVSCGYASRWQGRPNHKHVTDNLSCASRQVQQTVNVTTRSCSVLPSSLRNRHQAQGRSPREAGARGDSVCHKADAVARN